MASPADLSCGDFSFDLRVDRGVGRTEPADDWAALQAAVAEADAQLVTARSQGWWSGPVCSPDIELHRENAGQDPLPDEELRAECAANIAEFWASKEDYDRLQALDDRPARPSWPGSARCSVCPRVRSRR